MSVVSPQSIDLMIAKPLIIAHRGASAVVPENTLAAFRAAIEIGADGIEFDVRLTNDKTVVVFHDADLQRIADAEVLVEDLTFDELQNFDIGSWFNKLKPKLQNSDFASERIPTLEQTLELLKDYGGLIYIELKCRRKDVEVLSKEVCRIIEKSKLFPQIIVKSFNLDALPIVKQYCPEVKTAALFTVKVLTLLRKEKRLINIAKDLDVDFLSLHFPLATKNLMRKAARRNLQVAIWTADNPRWVKRAVKLGISHIITNNPAELLAKRREILLEKSNSA